MKAIQFFLNAALGIALASGPLSTQAQDPAKEPTQEKKAERLLIFSEGDDLKTIDLDDFQKKTPTERIAFLKEQGITHFRLDADDEAFEWTADSSKHNVVEIRHFMGDSLGRDKRMVWVEKGQHPQHKQIRIEHHLDTEVLADSTQRKKIHVVTTQPKTMVMVDDPAEIDVDVDVDVQTIDPQHKGKHKKVIIVKTEGPNSDTKHMVWKQKVDLDIDGFEQLPEGKTHEFKGKNGKVIVERNKDGELKIRFEEKK